MPARAARTTLRIELTKRSDTDVIFNCIRADGSATWQRRSGSQSLFFAFHDLTHLAVERELGTSQGFFGLIANGWDIDDTSGKGKRGALPPEAIWIEHLVGLIDRERIGGATPLSAEEMKGMLSDVATAGTWRAPPLDDGILTTIRSERELLQDVWARHPVGRPLEFTFECDSLR